MAEKKYTLIGKALNAAELARFPAEARASIKGLDEITAADLLNDEAIHHLDRLSLLMMTSVTLQCPVGPHDDPGLSAAVVRACNISKVGSVAVQCTQGHWAEYPCG
jgi:hypothetical protein